MDSNMINAWKIFQLDSINIPFFESTLLFQYALKQVTKFLMPIYISLLTLLGFGLSIQIEKNTSPNI